VLDSVVAELMGHRFTAMPHKHYSHLATKNILLADVAQRVRQLRGPNRDLRSAPACGTTPGLWAPMLARAAVRANSMLGTWDINAVQGLKTHG